MHLQPIFANYPFYGEGIAERLFRNGICLPSGSNLSDENRNKIKNVLSKIFSKIKVF
jgi:dTDP-4-amino-4,6-dideoxygalactose transaminase